MLPVQRREKQLDTAGTKKEEAVRIRKEVIKGREVIAPAENKSDEERSDTEQEE